MAELPQLGDHCNVKECNRLDFLPISCTHCKNIFCKDHSAFAAHNCPREIKLETKYKDIKSFKTKCDMLDCKDHTFIACNDCEKNFCLNHRHADQHQCPFYGPQKERMAQTKEHVKAILERKKSETGGSSTNVMRKGSKTHGRKSSATAAKVELMKMKMKCEGEKGIPVKDRIFCKFILPLCNHSKEHFKYAFFSSNWSIGRVIDSVAKLAGLENKNNIATEQQKLKLFSSENGELLTNVLSVADCIECQMFFSGSTLILEYVDKLTMKLEDFNKYLDTSQSKTHLGN